MSRSKRELKGKVLNEDLLVKVKPPEPWPDPPPKGKPAPQPTQKPSEGTPGSKRNPKQPSKKN